MSYVPVTVVCRIDLLIDLPKYNNCRLGKKSAIRVKFPLLVESQLTNCSVLTDSNLSFPESKFSKAFSHKVKKSMFFNNGKFLSERKSAKRPPKFKSVICLKLCSMISKFRNLVIIK